MTQQSDIPDFTFVNDLPALEKLAGEIRRAGSVALDTEADSYYHYHEKVCLIQAALPDGRQFIIDPLELPDIAPLLPLLASGKVVKVMHGSEYDVRLLKAGYNCQLSNIFDTLVARRLLGPGPFGLAALVEEFFQVKLSKKNQKGNWSARPLSPSLLRYALADVLYLHRLAELLSERLKQLGRLDWAREDFAALAELPPLKRRGDDADGYRKLKGVRQMTPHATAVLRELYLLRDRLAERADLAPFRVVNTEALREMALAFEKGKDPAQVRGAATFYQRYRAKINKTMTEAQIAEPQKQARRRGPSPAPDAGAVLKALRRARDEQAKRLQLEIGFLCPGNLLEKWARDRQARAALEGISGWRREQLEPAFRDALVEVGRKR